MFWWAVDVLLGGDITTVGGAFLLSSDLLYLPLLRVLALDEFVRRGGESNENGGEMTGFPSYDVVGMGVATLLASLDFLLLLLLDATDLS